MSISLAETATTHSVPTDPVAPPGVNASIIVWVLIAWALAGFVVATMLKAFNPKSVAGPERLADNDSAWDLSIVLLVGFFAGIATAAPMSKFLEKTNAPKQFADLSMIAAVDIATFAVMILVLKFYRRGSLRRLGLTTRKIGAGLTGGAVAIFVLDPVVQLTGLLIESLYNHFHLTQAKPHKVLVFLGEAHTPWVTAFAVSLPVIVAPFTEELMYRGLLQTALLRLFSWTRITSTPQQSPTNSTPHWLAIIGTSIIFAAVHGEPAFFPPLFILSIGLGYIYERTGNMWVPITCHAMFNAAQIILAAAAH